MSLENTANHSFSTDSFSMDTQLIVVQLVNYFPEGTVSKDHINKPAIFIRNDKALLMKMNDFLLDKIKMMNNYVINLNGDTREVNENNLLSVITEVTKDIKKNNDSYQFSKYICHRYGMPNGYYILNIFSTFLS